MKKRIVNTDNFGRDYPNEYFLNAPPLPSEAAEAFARVLNEVEGPNSQRCWKVVDLDYKLSPGFEP